MSDCYPDHLFAMMQVVEPRPDRQDLLHDREDVDALTAALILLVDAEQAGASFPRDHLPHGTLATWNDAIARLIAVRGALWRTVAGR